MATPSAASTARSARMSWCRGHRRAAPVAPPRGAGAPRVRTWCRVAASRPARAAGCAPAPDRAPAGPAVLYVANARDGTVTRVDGASGAVLGQPVPVRPALWRVVPDADGALLAQAGAPDDPLLFVPAGRAGGSGGAPAAPVSLAPYGRIEALAGDGRRWAVAVARPPPATPPRGPAVPSPGSTWPPVS